MMLQEQVKTSPINKMDLKTGETLFNIINTTITSNKNRCAYLRKGRSFTESRSYQDLHDEYSEAQHWLKTVPNHVLIGIHMKTEPCIPMLVYSFLGKGLCFTFLNPDEPSEKIKAILEELKPFAVISSNIEITFERFKESRICSTKCGTELNFMYNPNVEAEIYKDVCYIMCTSGTCGKRKYVRVYEPCIKSNILCLRERLSIKQEDVIYFGTPLTFDPSMVELFLALTSGATLTTVTKEVWENPQQLLTALFSKQCGFSPVTVLQICPSVLNRWTDDELQFLFTNSSLRVLALGGESFPEHLLSLKRKPGLRLFNLYGITEVSCWASCCEIRDVVTLGEPLDDTLLEVRDKNGGLVVNGWGEMYIGSETRICLLDDEKIEGIKLPVFRATGDLVHVKDKVYTYSCRTNRIIKRFGHRINLSLLEHNITASINLRNVCLWNEKLQKISTFLVLQDYGDNKSKILDKIRVKLLTDIEDKYFPDCIDLIREIPLTTNGKVNLKKLEELVTTSHDQSNLNIYKKLWCKYLCISEEIADERKASTFTEMGGSSVLRLQFVSELKEMLKSNFNAGFINILLDSSFEQACKLMEMRDDHSNAGGSHIDEEIISSKMFKVNWRVDMSMCIDAPATIFRNGDSLCVAVGNYAHIFLVLDVKSGEELYRVSLMKTIENACAVLDSSGRVYIGCFDGFMYCIDVNTKAIIWKFLTSERIKNTGCFTNNLTNLVFGSYDNSLYCVQLKDGTLVWKVDFSEPITSNPQCTNGLIIVACIKGTIACLEEISGRIIWKYKAKNPIFTNSEIVGNTVLYSDVCGYIYSINFQTGQLLWIYEPLLPTNMYSTFLVYNDMIIFGMKDKKVYILKFDEETCVLLQAVDVKYEINAKPKLLQVKHDMYLILVAVDGHVLLYKFINQELLLVDYMVLGGETFAQPVFYEDNMFIGCRDNHFYSISINL